MKYEITISPDAVTGYKGIPYEDRASFRDFISFRLSSDPEKVDDRSIQGLPGFRGMNCTLSVGEVQVFYDVIGPSVEILLALLSVTPTGDKITITRRGTPIATIPTVGIQELSESELQKKIDASRHRIRLGEGVLLNDLPL